MFPPMGETGTRKSQKRSCTRTTMEFSQQREIPILKKIFFYGLQTPFLYVDMHPFIIWGGKYPPNTKRKETEISEERKNTFGTQNLCISICFVSDINK